ncbi:MAG TPA: alpha-amylase family glycosyl hydrolase [Ignavibacteriaceae bacterium]|nr:alpha-amylase family glycosyl hydrolase [Ignavibacteriaceae bacterium]
MYLKNIQTKFIILLFLSLSSISFAQKISDIIEPINLVSERQDTFLVSDFFYSENYDVQFSQLDNFDIRYNKATNRLVIFPENKAEGIYVLNFTNKGTGYNILLNVNKPVKQLFTYKPEGKPKRVNLFGTFNSWNRENLSLTDENNDGIYEITIDIEPGRYEYKYFVDGKELVDPANPEKIPNGMGDFNNIVIIKPVHEGKVFLHNLGASFSNDNIQLTLYFDKENQKRALTPNEVFIFLDNQLLAEGINLEGNKIKITIPSKILGKENILRAVVNQDGQPTNIQNIFLKDGKPVDTKNNFDWHQSIIYSIMVDRFNDGDKKNSIPVIHPQLFKQANYNGGDLQGIINKIKDGYFNKLGINTLWITPIIDNTDSAYQEFPAPHRYYTGYHGYWPVHPTNVEERFGNINLFKELVSLAHQNNIKVLLDYVAHHVHIEHPFWNQHRDWFGKLELPDGRKNLRLWDEQRLTTWFEPYMPSFDYTASPEAVEAMTDNALWWLKETNVDGFRHDAVKHVPNLFWRRLTEKIREEIEIPQNKKVYQIGETFGGFELIKSYVNNGQLSAQFNFNIYDVAIPVFTGNSPFTSLDIQMQKSFDIYGENNLMGNLIDSHDKVRFMAYADGDMEGNVDPTDIAWNKPPKVDHSSSYKKLKLALAFVLTSPGVPVIYYGDEIGMTGSSDPDNRRMMRFSNLNKNEKESFSTISKLTKIRTEHSALNYGDFQTLQVDDNSYVYMRSDINERILVVLNKDNKNKNININLPEIYYLKEGIDLVSNKSYKVKNNSIQLNIDGIGFKILKLK